VDVPSFAEAIRRALRQDPDVILVGELRDLETISAAISAAETGHMVFGTLAHQQRSRDREPYHRCFPRQLAGSDSHPVEYIADRRRRSDVVPRIGGGRVAAYEVLVVTPGIANLIRENKTFRINSAIQTGAKFGMNLMDDACSICGAMAFVRSKMCCPRAIARMTWPSGLLMPGAASPTTNDEERLRSLVLRLRATSSLSNPRLLLPW
jgi:Tfp pilus assembly pilus retraction ATPase PilT